MTIKEIKNKLRSEATDIPDDRKFFDEEEKAWRESNRNLDLSPSAFGISDKETKKIRKDFLINKIDEETEYKRIMTEYLTLSNQNNHWFIFDELEKTNEELQKLKSNLYFLENTSKDRVEFNIQRIKQENRIIDYISRDRQIIRVGQTRLKCLCPFHEEKTPSFVIFENNECDTYHCFGCNKHGDVISLVMELEGLSFVETCKKLMR